MMFIFKLYSFDVVETQRLFWLFINVSFFKKFSKRFFFANWFMLFFYFWQSVANSLKRRSFNNLFIFYFVLFFIQITMSLKVEAIEEIIAVETSFTFITWYMNFVFVAILIFFFFHLFFKTLKVKRFVNSFARLASLF